MCKQEITFDKLPQAITYLTKQVAELKQLVSELQPPQSEKHLLVGIDDACRIIQKQSRPFMPLFVKGYFPLIRKERSFISMRMNYWHGSKTDERTRLSRTMTRCWPRCKTEYVANRNQALTFNPSEL